MSDTPGRHDFVGGDAKAETRRAFHAGYFARLEPAAEFYPDTVEAARSRSAGWSFVPEVRI